MNEQEIVSQLGLEKEKILGMFVIDDNSHSSLTVMIICETYRGPMSIIVPSIRATILDYSVFIKRLDNHEFYETLCMYVPPEKVLHRLNIRRPLFNLGKWIRTVNQETKHDLDYIARNENKPNIVLKARQLCLSKLTLAIQLAKNTQCVDFSASNKYFREDISGKQFDKYLKELMKEWTNAINMRVAAA